MTGGERLRLRHIEAGEGDLAALQRVDEGVGIDAATPGDGDNACTRLHQREGLCEERDQ